MDKRKQISIIGAGPAGSYAAYLLSKNADVSLYEEHKVVGSPVQCTGIVTSRINEIFKIPKYIITNKIKYARINSPDKNSIKIKIDDIILDRCAFDKFVFEKAIDNGVNAYLNTKFVGYDNNKIRLISNNKSFSKSTDILIGADGPSSKVRSYITNKKVDFYIGKQATVEGNYDKNVYDVYFNVDGFFSWIVPENESIARIGYAYKKFDKRYDEFIKRHGKILGYQAGPIPMFNPYLRTQKNNIYLVGDAATQIKSSTGGGIIQGMLASKCLANSIINNKNYDIAWRKKLFKELYVHKKIRDKLNKFNDEDYNYLINVLSKDKLKRILEKTNRDNLSKILFQLIKEPRILKYAFK